MARLFLITVFLFSCASVVAASEVGCDDTAAVKGHPLDCNRCHNLSPEEAGTMLSGIGKVTSVRHAPVRGLYEIALENEGKQGVAYLDYAKKHLIAGPVFSLETKQPVTDSQNPPAPQKPSPVDISSLPVKNSVLLGNPDGKKKLFVFTDPDCPFCSKLHLELIKLVYMEPDLAIYIKLFPLKMHPGAYDKSRVILGGDSAYLLNKAFAGEQLPAPTEKDRKEPVDETIKLAESLGITSTPTLVLPDGRIVIGYREAAAIKKLLQGEIEK